MKRDSLSELEHGLSELKNYVEFNISANSVISSLQNSSSIPEDFEDLIERSDKFQRKKVFEYNSYIITLYGLLERFLEKCLSDYLESLCKILEKYDRLPEKIKESNLELSTNLLNSLAYPKYQHLKKESVIVILNDSLNNNNAVLNIEAFQHHTYNFKSSVIKEYFLNVGLGDINGKLTEYPPFNEYLEKEYTNYSNLPSKIIYNILDDLAERRNDVAHGVEGTSILNHKIISEYIQFIRIYCKSVFRYTKDNLLEHQYSVLDSNFQKNKVFNNEIITGHIDDLVLKPGDYILSKKPKGNFPRYMKNEIQNLEIAGKTQEVIKASNKTGIGIKIDEKVKSNYKFKLLV